MKIIFLQNIFHMVSKMFRKLINDKYFPSEKIKIHKNKFFLQKSNKRFYI